MKNLIRNSAIFQTIKRNKVTGLLLLTVVIGVMSTAFDYRNEIVNHPSGKEGHTMKYFVWFVGNYLNGFVLLWALFLNKSENDKIVLICYVFWDLIGFFNYLYNGWPEPKELIIISFAASVCLFFIIKAFTK